MFEKLTLLKTSTQRDTVVPAEDCVKPNDHKNLPALVGRGTERRFIIYNFVVLQCV